MEHNFTPLDINKYPKQNGVSNKKDTVWTVFLFLGVITLIIVAFLLFILIQQKIKTSSFVPRHILALTVYTMYE